MGAIKGKQAKDVVLLRGFHVLHKIFSRTVAEAWVVLQVEYRHKLGIHVDYKAAQREGEW